MNFKKDFPIFKSNLHKGLVYLDSAATSQKPQCVIDAIIDFYQNHNANISRGIYNLSEEATKLYIDARLSVSKFINCDLEEIIFTRNATESINLVAYSFAMNHMTKGDNIIISLLEHHSNLLPWQMLQERGIGIRYININNDGILDLEQYKSLLDKNTKLVAITHVSNSLGVVNPIKEMIKIAHENYSKILVDVCQSIPHMKIDVKQLDCDFIAFSGHKMFAPTGIGVLYGKKDILRNMPPFLRGGGMITDVQKYSVDFSRIPEKFEAGTPNISGAIGLKAAIEYIEKIDIDKIQKHSQNLLKYAIRELQKLHFIRLLGPLETNIQCAIISFIVKGVHDHDVSAFLNEKGICVRAGKHCTHPLFKTLEVDSTVRASFSIYNTKEDIDKLILALREVYKVFQS